MKINRLMQVVFLSSSVCVAAPAFASVLSSGHDSSPSCGDEKDEDDKEEDKDGETRLCGDDTDEDDDDGEGDDTETRQL